MDKIGTEVNVIRNKGGLSLIEWRVNGSVKRSWVPVSEVRREGSVSLVNKPAAGIPHGHNFAKLLTPSVTPDAIDEELKRHGIWTIEDLRANPNSALGALQSAYGVDLASLFQAADKYEADHKKGAESKD